MWTRCAAGLALALAAAGCGTPSHDLFAVERAGSIPGAKLRMIVSDGGTVTCDGGKAVSISSEEDTARRYTALEAYLRQHA